MVIPNEVPKARKCISCEVKRPLIHFLRFSIGKKAGQFASSCLWCSLDSRWPPIKCKKCGEFRPKSEFDKAAAKGAVCKPCLMAEPWLYKKTCPRCEKSKKLTGFHNLGKTQYKYFACRDCEVSRTIQKRKKSPIRQSAIRRAHYRKMKLQAYTAYGGFICRCCGETEESFLTLDHINNDGAEWRRAIFGRNRGAIPYEWCKANGYPPIFQVLCWNCQQGKRYNDGICPHQRKRVEIIP